MFTKKVEAQNAMETTGQNYLQCLSHFLFSSHSLFVAFFILFWNLFFLPTRVESRLHQSQFILALELSQAEYELVVGSPREGS